MNGNQPQDEKGEIPVESLAYSEGERWTMREETIHLGN
jgi:hypothetical protein